jgi:membrane fusion protein YbhG
LKGASPSCSVDPKSARLWRAVIPGVAVLVIAGAMSGCKWPWADQGPSSSILLSGSIEARETDLAFQVPGRIAHLAVDEGDRVAAGQKVASLDPRDYELALARAQADAEVSKASLAVLEAGTRQQELRVAAAAVAQAEAQLKFARAETRRIAQLMPKQLAAQDQMDRAQLQEDVAQATLTQTQQQLALLKEGTRIEEIARARADYRAKQQAVAIAQQQLSYVNLASPAAGDISVRLTENGEVVAPGQAVMRVAAMNTPWVRAYISEMDLPRVRLGQAAEVRVDGLPGKVFKGRVAFISPEAEFTPKTVETRELRVDLVYRIKVEVDNPDGALKIGMPADVTITSAAS